MQNNFANNLKYLREEKKMSQQELADKINVDRSTIGYWENNKADPSLKNVAKLAEVLDIEIISLIGDDLRRKPNTGLDLPKLSHEEKKRIVKAFFKEKGLLNENEDISDEELINIINFAKANRQFLINSDMKKNT